VFIIIDQSFSQKQLCRNTFSGSRFSPRRLTGLATLAAFLSVASPLRFYFLYKSPRGADNALIVLNCIARQPEKILTGSNSVLMSKPQSQYRSARLTIHKLLPTALTGWSLALLAGSVAGLAAFRYGFPGSYLPD
jgi:hypothetical protein